MLSSYAPVRRRRAAPPDRSERHVVADVALRLAVLVRAGLSPERSWAFVADASESLSVTEIDRRMKSGSSVPRAIEEAGSLWHPLAAAWIVASEVGAPLADTLLAFSRAFGEAADTLDDIAVAVAEPLGTAKLMGWLPLGGILIGILLGFDPLSALTHPLGVVCVGAGVVLMVLARVWTRALDRAAQPGHSVPGLEEDLCATALAGGVSVDRALAVVDAALTESGSMERGKADRRGSRRLRRIVDLSQAAGAPALELLRAEATRARRLARVEGRLAAVRLSRRLLIPLGVCTLPAFLLLTIVPLLLSVLAGAEVAW